MRLLALFDAIEKPSSTPAAYGTQRNLSEMPIRLSVPVSVPLSTSLCVCARPSMCRSQRVDALALDEVMRQQEMGAKRAEEARRRAKQEATMQQERAMQVCVFRVEGGFLCCFTIAWQNSAEYALCSVCESPSAHYVCTTGLAVMWNGPFFVRLEVDAPNLR